MKYLITNADDFGMSKLFNKRIIELFESGSLTSTSVMIKSITPDQSEQVEKLKSLKDAKDISVGLHVVFENESFREQIQEQYNLFSETFGFEPSHIDLHKSTYLENGYSVIVDFCAEKNIPCKNHGIKEGEALMTESKCFMITGLIWDEVEELLNKLEDGKIYALIFHPGYYDTNCPTKFNKVREVDAKLAEKLSKNSEKYNLKLVSYSALHGINKL